jgi:serine/threonine-protein kinase
MSTPEKAPLPMQKPGSGVHPKDAVSMGPQAAPNPAPPAAAPSAPAKPALIPRPGLKSAVAPSPAPAAPPPAAVADEKPLAESGPQPAAAAPPAVTRPSAVSIVDVEPNKGPPRVSDPELQKIASAIQGRDPEASLDIPPPAEVTPPEERGPDTTDPYIGTTFDHRYKIQKLLGEGGMGYVYLARHKVIDKKVAVKVLRSDMARDREILDRFLQEAKAASSIGNPHIVDISDFGDLPDGSTYFVMEFLEGQSLSQLVDSGVRLPVERICHIAIQLCEGLGAAHQRGIVHRDLKPDNVYLIERGSDHDFIKILDFGIAKVSGNANTKLTKAGAVFGTPHYMSPEQAAGAPVDHRTDIYALGVMLYEMVSGQLPFNADNFMGILTQHMYKAPVPIRALVPGPECPPGLEAVILKCLSKKPEGRYQSMEELAADLERVRSGGVANAVTEMMARSGGFNVPADYFKHPSVIVPATPPTPAKKWSRVVWIAGAAAAVAIVAVIFVISGITNAVPKTTAQSAAPTATAAPTTVAASATATAAAPPKKTTPVAVAALPETAMVYRDGNPVHKVPWSIEIEEGSSVTIEFRADGYETETLTLDGSEVSKMVKLKLAKGVRPAGAGKVPVGKTGKGGKKSGKNGEVVEPW